MKRTFGMLFITLCAGLVACDQKETTSTSDGSSRETSDDGKASGYIEVVVDGDAKRFEYLNPKNNELDELELELQAEKSADDDHGFRIYVRYPNLGDEELPLTLDRSDIDEAGGTVAVSLTYRDEQGRTWASGHPTLIIEGLEGKRIKGRMGEMEYKLGPNDRLTIESGTFDIVLAERE